MEDPGGGAAAENNASSHISYDFNRDPAIVGFTWKELLAYNISFLRGEKKATFYHAGPLWEDQIPTDLIRLHELGVLTVNGQGTGLEEGYNENTGLFWKEEQRAYLDGFIQRDQANKLIQKAKDDPEVILEVSEILTGKQIYLSPEIAQAWAHPPHTLSLTRSKVAAKKEDVNASEWENETTNPSPMGGVYELERIKFKNWYRWVCGGLCYFSITDKEYGQEPKSLPERMIAYLTAAGGKRRKSKSARRRHKKHGKKTRRA
jgi:hypothetical protein